MVCKNKEKCIFLSSQACEFLHNETTLGNTDGNKILQDSISDIKGFVKGIEEQFHSLDAVIKQTQNKLSAMEKDVHRNSQMEK